MLRLAVSGALFLGLAVACGSSDSSGSGGAAGKGGAAGASGTGGTSGTGGSSGAAGTAGSAGSGGTSACSETPCKLVAPQCGCGAGEACVLLGSQRSCALAGNVGEGMPCQATGSCQPGFECLNSNDAFPTCTRLCDSNADCEAPGGICIDRNIGVKVCTQNCDPIAQTGCPAQGEMCVVAVSGFGPLTNCVVGGTKQQGESCGSEKDCAPGTDCFATTPTLTAQECLAWCDVDSPNCPTGTVCTSLATVGSKHYGYCKPSP